MAREPQGIQGGNVVELADDMLTVISEPKRLAPGQFDGKGNTVEDHAFFVHHLCRKIGDTYYYIYSSQVNHELCYATSKYPDPLILPIGMLLSPLFPHSPVCCNRSYWYVCDRKYTTAP